jgi:hypothetical protein
MLFRCRHKLVPWLIGLFLVAQFAGAVPRVAYAHGDTNGAVAHADGAAAHEHCDHRGGVDEHQDDHGITVADQCCALHLLTGVVSAIVPTLYIEYGARPSVDTSAMPIAGIDANALFRPPRTL